MARIDGKIVQQLQRFLDLQATDNAGDGGGSGDFASSDFFAAELRAAITEVEEAIIVFGHAAFVARALGRDENFDDAVDFLDTAVDPGCINFPAGEVVVFASFGVAPLL